MNRAGAAVERETRLTAARLGGGEIVGTGPPERIVDLPNSFTGKYLRPMLEKK